MNKDLENILKNSNVLKERYTDCINNGLGNFNKVEKEFVKRLLKTINDYLQKITDENKPIDFHKDVQGHYYEVFHICNYTEWPEWKEYLKYIKSP